MKPYEPDFAHVYDFLVHEQPEALADETELNFVSWAFARMRSRPVQEILDVGCGKGRYLIPLAQAGYQLTGLDNSTDMLEDCRSRLERRGLQARLLQRDMETLDLHQQYDAVICIDSVLCYLLETDQIIHTLTRFRQALRPQGILVLENWNILAQWHTFGKTLSHQYENERLRVEWTERYEYETFSSIFRTDFSGHWVEKGVKHQFHRQEILLAMTVGEVKASLKEAGFAQVSAHPSHAPSEFDHANSEVMSFLGMRP